MIFIFAVISFITVSNAGTIFNNIKKYNFHYSAEIDSLEKSFKENNEKDYYLALKIAQLYNPFSKIKSIYYYNKSYEIALLEESSYKINKSLLNLIDFYHNASYVEKEESLLKEMMANLFFPDSMSKEYSLVEKLHTIQNDTTIFFLLLKNARFYQEVDSLKKSEKFLDLAHRAAFKFKNKSIFFFNEVYFSFARQRLKEGFPQRAFSYLKQIGNHYDLLLDQSELAWNLYEAGRILAINNLNGEARTYFEKASNLFSSTNDNFGLAYVFYQLALISAEDSDLYQNFLKNVLTSIVEFQKAAGKDLYQKTVYLLSKFYLDNNQYQLAESLLQNYLQDFEGENSISDFKILTDFYGLLKDCYERQNKFENALRSYSEFTRYKDSIENKQEFIRLDELTLHYETLDRERQNDLLNKDNSIYRLELTKERIFKYFLIFIIVFFIFIITILFLRSSRNKRLNKELEEKVRIRTNELLEKNKKLNIAYNKVKLSQEVILKQEKLASLGTMVAGIAHEINNPGQAIKFSSQSMQMNIDDLRNLTADFENLLNDNSLSKEMFVEEVKNLLNKYDFKTIIEELETIVSDNLDAISRIEHIVKSTKRMSYKVKDIQECNLEEIVQDVLILLKSSVKNTAKIDLQFQNDLPFFKSNPNDFGQIFINLINNSIDAVKEKNLSYSEAKIMISAMYYKSINKIKITFEDNGCGIDKNLLEKIYDPFFTTKKIGKGTGLGLNIIYRIVKAHNGEIICDSVEGEGTKFTIWLPV